MTLEQFHQISEIVAAIVVAVTLVFLTVQMRQNTKALRSTATQAAHDQVAQIYNPLMSDPSLAEICFIKGLQQPLELSTVESARFLAFWMQLTFNLQNWFIQTQEGAIESSLLDSWSQNVADLSDMPGFKYFWERRKHAFSPKFQQYLETEVLTRERTPGYRPLGVPEEQVTPPDH